MVNNSIVVGIRLLCYEVETATYWYAGRLWGPNTAGMQ